MVIVSPFTQDEVNKEPYPGWLAKPVLVSRTETRKDQTANSATATPTTMALTRELIAAIYIYYFRFFIYQVFCLCYKQHDNSIATLLLLFTLCL